MKTFQSTAPDGRTLTWEVAFSYALLKRMKGLLGVDLMQPEAPLSEQDERTVVMVVHHDLAKFVDLLYVACQKQAESAGLTDEQFGEMLDDAAFLGARTAFFAEWEDFFSRAGVTAQAAALRKQREILVLAGGRIEQIPTEHFMTHVDKALASLTAGPSATNSPA